MSDTWCRTIAVASAIALTGGCSPPKVDPRPSIALVVIDTLRADAVSAYGVVEGTTPAFDALASDGLLYEHAYAPSPWTLPSHASLLTGFGADRHRVGIAGRMRLHADFTTLAERLSDAGYQTAGFSENPLVSGLFGLDQGFERFSALTFKDAIDEEQEPESHRFDIVAEVATFAAERDRSRPFFLFVNLFDPHVPYQDRKQNRFVDPDVSVADRWAADALKSVPYLICDRVPSSEDVATLHGLYLGDVAAADAKLGEITAIVREATANSPLIVVATADHGEHFGEHRLLGHEFSVRGPVLNIPLVVQGIPDVAAGRVDARVTLEDVAASILSWAGTEIPSEIGGRPLPTDASEANRPSVDLLAIYDDRDLKVPEDLEGKLQLSQPIQDRKRSDCWPRDHVYGNMVALTRWPFKLIWFENYPSELYDLSWDPSERSDLTEQHPEISDTLFDEAQRLVDEIGLEDLAGAAEVPSAAELEILRGLGYGE